MNFFAVKCAAAAGPTYNTQIYITTTSIYTIIIPLDKSKVSLLFLKSNQQQK